MAKENKERKKKRKKERKKERNCCCKIEYLR